MLCIGTVISVVRAARSREMALEFRFEPAAASRGTPVQIVVTVTAGRIAPDTVLVGDLQSASRRHPVSMRFERRSAGDRVYRFSMQGIARGVYRLEAARLLLSDPFRLTRVTPPFTLQGGVLRITPRTADIPPVRALRGEGEYRSEPRLAWERGGERIDIRPYVPGDDVGRIHWNVYAHTQELYFRIPEELPPPTRSVVIVVDTEQPDAEVLDQVIESALGLASRLVAEEHRVILAATVPGERDRLDWVGVPEEARTELAGLDHLTGLSARAFRPASPAPGGEKRLFVTIDDAAEWVIVRRVEGGSLAAQQLAQLNRNW